MFSIARAGFAASAWLLRRCSASLSSGAGATKVHILPRVQRDGVGPSGQEYFYDSNGNQVRAPDYGALVLIGTESQPIEINGPVIIPSDVITRGYVKGQGTIYSGRNIHIVGDIKYKNPPSWNNKSTSGSDNKNKDLLGLMAKGNIVLGNYTDSKLVSDDKVGLAKSSDNPPQVIDWRELPEGIVAFD